MDVVGNEYLNTFHNSNGDVKKISADGSSYRIETDEQYIYLSDETLEKMLPVQIYQALQKAPKQPSKTLIGVYDEFLLRREFQDDQSIEPLSFDEMARAAELNILKNSINAEKLTTLQIRKLLEVYKKEEVEDGYEDGYEEKTQRTEDDTKRKRVE